MSGVKRKDYKGSVAKGNATLEGVQAGDTFKVNGIVYTAVAGAKGDNTKFSIDTSDTAAATDLADSIENDNRSGDIDLSLSASSNGNKVTVTADGTDSDKIKMNASDTITLSGPHLVIVMLESSVGINNPVVKRVNHMNSPYSVQATGNDLIPGRIKAVTTSAEFNALTARTEVLLGNKKGWIKSVTADTSLVFVTLDIERNEVETTLTMQQVFNSGDLTIIDAIH